QQQRVYLQTLINQYKTYQGTSRTADGTPTRLPAVDKELGRLKAQLAELSSHYTDSYPDIRNLKSQIAKTEKVRADLIVDLKNKGSVANQPDGGVASEVADPSQNSP